MPDAISVIHSRKIIFVILILLLFVVGWATVTLINPSFYSIDEGPSIEKTNQSWDGYAGHHLPAIRHKTQHQTVQNIYAIAYIIMLLAASIYIVNYYSFAPKEPLRKEFSQEDPSPHPYTVAPPSQQHNNRLQLFLDTHKIDIIFVGLLLLMSFKYLVFIENIVDLPFYDEAVYLDLGLKLSWAHFPPTAKGPLYTLWYFLLSRIESDPVQLVFLNYKILITANLLALYWFMRRISIPSSISVITAFFYLMSPTHAVSPLVTHFASFLFILFLIIATYSKQLLTRYLISGTGLLFIAYIRAEYYLSFLLFIIFGTIYIFTQRENTVVLRAAFLKILLFLFIVIALFSIFGDPLYGGFWRTFGHHFTEVLMERTGISFQTTHPKAVWQETIKDYFANAKNIWEVMRNNPKTLFTHIFYNLKWYVIISLRLLLTHTGIKLYPVWNKCIIIAQAVFLNILIAYFFKNASSIKKTIDKKTFNHFFIHALFVQISVIISALIIQPHWHYLTIQSILIFIFLAYFFAHSNPFSYRLKRLNLPGAIILSFIFILFTPNSVLGWTLWPQKNIAKKIVQGIDLPKKQTIEFIHSLPLRGGIILLCQNMGYHAYSDKIFQEFYFHEIKPSFYAFLKDKKINMVLWEKWRNSFTYFNDVQVRQFNSSPEKWGFIKIDIPYTENKLYIHKTLMEQFNFETEEDKIRS